MKPAPILLSIALSSAAAAVSVVAAPTEGPVMAPAFTLKCAEGETHSLSDYKGKWLVLEWVNFECPYVHKQYASGAMPARQAHFQDEGVVWLSICSSAEGKQGYYAGDALRQRLAREKHAATEYLIDADGKVGRAYGAKTTPHLFIVDPEGRLVYQGGIDDLRSTEASDIFVTTNYVVEGLTAAKEDREIPHPRTRPYGCAVKY